MARINSGNPEFLSGGVYHVEFYSPGGAGTGKVQYSADGANYRDVADTSYTGSGGFTLTVGDDESGVSRHKFTLTGDTVCNRYKIRSFA